MERKEVEKIYKLANLSLEGKDADKLADKFNKVLDFVEDIFEVDTDGVKEFELISNHDAAFREDKQGESISRSAALSNAKDTELGSFKIDWKL